LTDLAVSNQGNWKLFVLSFINKKVIFSYLSYVVRVINL
jgi:hypothetical protein